MMDEVVGIFMIPNTTQVDDDERVLNDVTEMNLQGGNDEIDEIDVQMILVVLWNIMPDEEEELHCMRMFLRVVDDYEVEGIDLWLIIVTDTKLLLQLQQQIIDDEVDDEYTVLLILLDVQVVNE